MAVLDSPFDLPEGRLLALDLGQVRIGVAVCDAAGLFATPLAVLPRRATRVEDFAAIMLLVMREKVVGVLAGMPAAAGEEGGQQARWTRRYAGRLAGVLPVPLAFWDETLSSVTAAERLAASGSKTGVDAAAAAVILEEYLAVRRAGLVGDPSVNSHDDPTPPEIAE